MYDVTDITELIRHHLVLPFEDDTIVDRNLVQLVHNIEAIVTTRRPGELISWIICEGCGASVSSELICPGGAGETAEGAFCCTSCRFGDDG